MVDTTMSVDLAYVLNCSRTKAYRLRNGYRVPSLQEVMLLSTAFGFSTDALVEARSKLRLGDRSLWLAIMRTLDEGTD
jgi:hypothetical protein